MNITKKDLIWNYIATFLKIASSFILLPFILNKMPSEKVGIWSVFITISAFTSLLDFGFNQTFSRNITYIFSGVTELKREGYTINKNKQYDIDYNLLKSLIKAMRWFYSRISLVLLIILAFFGTYYISSILNKYHGNHLEIFIAWGIFCIINTYNLYTLYYDSLLLGIGLIKKSKQITIIGQLVYLTIAATLIILGYGLIAIVTAQASSVIIIRWLSYNAFYTKRLIIKLKNAETKSVDNIFKIIYPNAIKIGLTSLGAFLIQRSSIILGSIYLPLDKLASYSITMQIISVIGSLSTIYTSTYLPKISQLRINQNDELIKIIYLRGIIVLLLTYLCCGSILIIFGEFSLNIIRSQTELLPLHLLILGLVLNLEQVNLSNAGSILVTKNEVPFYKASIISGIFIILGLYISIKIFNIGLLGLIIIPLLVDISFQTWKWPLEVIKDLNIKFKDVVTTIKTLNIKLYA